MENSWAGLLRSFWKENEKVAYCLGNKSYLFRVEKV